MRMEGRHPSMDPTSSDDMYSSMTDLSKSPSRCNASPYSCASASVYQGQQSPCPKTNRRVPSMTAGSTSNSGPYLSGYATDDVGLPEITEEKKDTPFSVATDDGPTLLEGRKPRTFFGHAADLVKKMGGVTLSPHEKLILAELERRMKTLFDEAAEIDRRTVEQTERKQNYCGFVIPETKCSTNGLLGNASDDGSLIREHDVSLAVSAAEGSMTAKAERKNNMFADVADDSSRIAEGRKSTSFTNAIDDRSVTAVSGKNKLWFADAIADRPTVAERRTKGKGGGRANWMTLMILLFLLLGGFVLTMCFSSLFEPSLTADTLRSISEESMASRRLSDRLDLVARKLSSIVPGQVVNCTGSKSAWKFKQDGMLVYSYCTLYSSMVEEVSLWGFPSQTVGVLDRGITDRSFTIMSGRMIQWFEGRTDYAVYEEGDSWTHEMLTASVIQMDGKTWILEYKPSATLQGSGLISWVVRFLKWRVRGICETRRSNFRSFLPPELNVGRIRGDLRTPT